MTHQLTKRSIAPRRTDWRMLATWLSAALTLATAIGADPPQVLRVEGEVIARQSAALLPPKVDGLWQLNITQLAADDAPMLAGQPVTQPRPNFGLGTNCFLLTLAIQQHPAQIPFATSHSAGDSATAIPLRAFANRGR